MQKISMASSTFSIDATLRNSPAKIRGAMTNRFFTHWRGRIRVTSPPARARGERGATVACMPLASAAYWYCYEVCGYLCTIGGDCNGGQHLCPDALDSPLLRVCQHRRVHGDRYRSGADC